MRPIRFVLPTFLLTTLFSTTVLAQSTPSISTPVISSSSSMSLVSKSAVGGLSQPDPAKQAKMIESYGKLPLSFEANQGQADARVKFLSRTGGHTLFLSGDEAVLTWSGSAAKKPDPKGAPGFGGDTVSPKRYPDTKPNPATAQSTTGGVLRMKLLNANPKTEVSGQDELPGKSNYFIGNDPKKWHTSVRQFSKVRYGNVYPGVDLVYYGHQRELEYDFVLQPGADPQLIRLGIEGTTKLRLEHGDLVMASAAGDVHLRSPHIYQEANGVRYDVRGGYMINAKGEVGFEVEAYDRRRALVIDPVLAYSTYLGGSLSDSAWGVAVDSAGNAFVTGQTISNDFPIANALQGTEHGSWDVFVTKINADGTALVYSTYLGGSAQDGGYSIAVDSAGNAYVTGYTASTDFPTVNPIQPANHTHAESNAFVTKINASGDALVYSTYLGGSKNDFGFGIAVGSAGNVYVTGAAGSPDFPTFNAFQPVNGGLLDAFVTKINAAGSAFVYSTYLGGGQYDNGNGIAVDSGGNAYVVGSTWSTDFPTKNAIQGTDPDVGSPCAFVAKITADGSALAYSTYLGGGGLEYGNGIAVDGAGRAYVTGQTASADFPTKNAIQPVYGGGGDAFVTKINASGSAFVYSTYLGGSGEDSGAGIAVDSTGEAYVTGFTWSNALNDFPTVNAIQPSFGGNYDAFVAKINASGSALVYSTYLGGSASDVGRSVAVDTAGSAYVAGSTNSTSRRFPTTVLSFQPSTKGVPDGFVTKIAAQTFVSLSKSNLLFPVQVVGTKSAAKTITVTNQGSSSLPVNSIFVGGLNASDFAETNTCDSSLAAGASCTISVTFAPTTKETRKAGVGISSSDPASPNAIALSGTGTVVSLSATTLSFGMHAVGTTSAPQSVTLTNTGSTPLNFTGISIAGTNAGDFSQTNTCGTSIAAKASCTITVTFSPTATGTRLARLSIRDDGGGSPQRVALSGKGT